MIKSFSCEETEKLYAIGKSSKFGTIKKVAMRKLDYIDGADDYRDIKVPPGNDFKELSGKMKGCCSIRINALWRIYFKFEKGNAYDVKIDVHL